ncbi:putative Microcephalin [Amylocarpus encephaloides]|uniref:Microcephalin n=1 Tax=Amylocarpus encephaloides TaxID=45428 RepID=A0A9P7YR97_9HELO|nr:putative Microcephalin [Amylocarpus encephaloides]
MNEQSPPKRVTRARAAAKTTDTRMKTKVAPATKAKVTRTASTTKRKIRAEDLEEEQDDEDPLQEMNLIIEPAPARATRGRAKKVIPAEPVGEPVEPIAKTTRGRANKTADAPIMEPTRSLRGRPKKIAVSEGQPVEQLPKRATRIQPTTITKTAASKKTVKFEELDKENNVLAPANTKGKAKVTETATGLRAKPVRKPAAPAARATRGRAKATVDENAEKSSLLSPKKATQVRVNTEQFSEDELAISEKTPMKSLMKSPVKPSGSVFNSPKKLDFSTSISVQKAIPSTTSNLGASGLGSPARRPPQSPFKESFKASPQKMALGESAIRSPFKPSLPAPSASSNSVFKASLLQSPARRPQSPTKVAENGSPSRASKMSSLMTETPKMAPFKMSKFSIPRTINRSPMRLNPPAPSSVIKAQTNNAQETTEDIVEEDISTKDPLQFSGRLSSIMPREADPTSTMSEEIVEEPVDQRITEDLIVVDAIVLDNEETTLESEMPSEDSTAETAAPPRTPLKFNTGTFTVPEGDDHPFHESDSEDELTAAPADFQPGPFAGFRTSSHEFESYPSTPFTTIAKTPRAAKTPRTSIRASISKAQNHGFTPLARQLSDWMTSSPQKSDVEEDATLTIDGPSSESAVKGAFSVAPSPMKNTYFDDEMSVRDELALDPESEATEEDILEDNFSSPELDEQDLDLANEADEMSSLEPEEIEAIQAAEEELDAEKTLHFEEFEAIAAAHQESESDEIAPSEASQEYGNENDMTKGVPRGQLQQEEIMPDACATPSKDSAALWSTLGTPPQTPRRDIDASLLKGVVVFVDVYTTEGADASVLFTELLTQMGARCIKQWNWNCSEGSKIGITHVVYKDGGKRTLEKVREAQGVVSCVGVGWVLDCERENKWLDEALYVVDTSIIPRGGHRRRRTMEPKALVNFNGTLSSSTTPGRKSNASPTKEFLNMETPYKTKSKRRESVQWVRSPSTLEDELADTTLMLSPIPVTPAPGTISAYGEEGLYGEDTPVGQTPYFLHKEQLIQKTAPPAKGRFFGTPSGDGSSGLIGEGFLSEKKDESVMMRLMAARRKSLQFAPKIGSPLARAQGF